MKSKLWFLILGLHKWEDVDWWAKKGTYLSSTATCSSASRKKKACHWWSSKGVYETKETGIPKPRQPNLNEKLNPNLDNIYTDCNLASLHRKRKNEGGILLEIKIKKEDRGLGRRKEKKRLQPNPPNLYFTVRSESDCKVFIVREVSRENFYFEKPTLLQIAIRGSRKFTIAFCWQRFSGKSLYWFWRISCVMLRLIYYLLHSML